MLKTFELEGHVRMFKTPKLEGHVRMLQTFELEGRIRKSLLPMIETFSLKATITNRIALSVSHL